MTRRKFKKICMHNLEVEDPSRITDSFFILHTPNQAEVIVALFDGASTHEDYRRNTYVRNGNKVTVGDIIEYDGCICTTWPASLRDAGFSWWITPSLLARALKEAGITLEGDVVCEND